MLPEIQDIFKWLILILFLIRLVQVTNLNWLTYNQHNYIVFNHNLFGMPEANLLPTTHQNSILYRIRKEYKKTKFYIVFPESI